MTDPGALSSAPPEAEGGRFNYFGLVPLSLLPLFVVTVLLANDLLERLPLALQALLVAVAFIGGLLPIALLTRERWRDKWLRLHQGVGRWRVVWFALNTLYIWATATWAFAVLSGFLYLHDVGTVSPGALADPFNDFWYFYAWSFVNAIPTLDLTETIGWEVEFRLADRGSRILLLLYKLAVIIPVITTGKMVWTRRGLGEGSGDSAGDRS